MVTRASFVLLCLLLSGLLPGAATSAAENPQTPIPERVDDGTPAELVRLEDHFGVLTEGANFERLKRVSEPLLASLSEEERAQIKAIRLLDDDTVNAFATPSGYIYFFNGLLNELETDDQCAGVLAHECTHVLHKHSQEIGKDAWKYQIGGLLAAVLMKEPGLMTAGQVLGHSTAVSYTRKAEVDADQTGLFLMTRAGFKPIGMLEFMNHLERTSRSEPLLEEGYFLTHPYPAERRSAIADWMRGHGYTVPIQITKTRPSVSAEEWRPDAQSPPEHLMLTVAGREVFRFAGDTRASRDRAERTVVRLQAVLEAGALDYDFSVKADEAGPQITTRHGYILTVLQPDADLAGTTREALAEDTLKRLKQVLWERRMRQRLGGAPSDAADETEDGGSH